MHILRRVWVVVVYAYLLPLLRGVGGALSVWQPLRFFAANAAARAAFFKCFQLNGALFLGSMGAMYFGVAPALRALVGLTLQVLGLVGGGNATAAEVAAAGGAAGQAVEVATAGGSSGAEFVAGHSGLAEARPQQQALETSAEFVSSLIFHVLWLYPVYCISFILNAAWYQEVADEAQRYFTLKAGVSGGGGAAGATGGGLGFFKVVRDEIFRLLLMLGFVVQASVLGMLSAPVGPLLAFACYSWLFSFYCFEYGWSARGWRLLRRTRHFERDWLFYLGFGAPGAAATTLFPTVLMNGGVFALVFPLFIAVGAHCDAMRTRRRDQAGSGGGGGNDDGGVPFLDEFRVQLPVFWFPVLLANFLVKMIQLCCCAKWGGGGGAAARVSDDGGRQGGKGGAGKKLAVRSKSSRRGSSRSSAPATPSAAGDASTTSAA